MEFEEGNRKAYELLLKIEIVLRELVKCSMETQFGSGWQKRLPGELLKKVKQSQRDESKPQFDFVRLGPLYYLTFGELVLLLQQSIGLAVAKRFGGEVFVKQLENLFSPRNAVCHSRPVSSVGLQVIECVYLQMEAALGPSQIDSFIANPDVGFFPDDTVRILAPIFSAHLKAISGLPACFDIPKAYEKARAQYWWGDHDLAGFDCKRIDDAVIAIRSYNALPGGVGAVGLRQRASDAGVRELLSLAAKELEGASQCPA